MHFVKRKGAPRWLMQNCNTNGTRAASFSLVLMLLHLNPIVVCNGNRKGRIVSGICMLFPSPPYLCTTLLQKPMAAAPVKTALHAFIIFSRVTAFTRTGSGDVGLRKMSCLHSKQAKHRSLHILLLTISTHIIWICVGMP